MAHLGEDTLKKLSQMTVGMETEPAGCIAGRMKGGAHTHLMKRGEAPLELIHTDICGQFPYLGIKGDK
jgi:hypothetical protein